MTKPTNIKAAALVLDYGVYPRHQLSDLNLRRISAALELGEKMPAVVADSKTKRVVDGFHRVTATLRNDPDGSVPVELVDYPDDSSLFLDAVRRNARHGEALTPFDHARVVLVADEFKIGREELAMALATPLATLEKMKVSRSAKRVDGSPIVIKRSLRPLAGTTLTVRQEEINSKASGWSAIFHAEQIVMLIEAGVVDFSNEATRIAFSKVLDCLTPRMAVA